MVFWPCLSLYNLPNIPLCADHYSQISTVCANWNLPTLGRFDVGANVFSLVASKTGDKVRTNPSLSSTFLNKSYPGMFNNKDWAPQPMPNTSLVVNGREVSKSVKAKWGSVKGRTYYSGELVLPDGRHPPVYKDAVTVSTSSTDNSTTSNSTSKANNNTNSASEGLQLRWLWLLASLVALFGLMFI